MYNSKKVIEDFKKDYYKKEKENEILEASIQTTSSKDTIKIEESLEGISEEDIANFISLEEATTAGMQMRSYEAKKAAAVAAIAVGMAKKNHDPMYERLTHHRHAWKSIKNQLLQRYYSQAQMKWQSGQNK